MKYIDDSTKKLNWWNKNYFFAVTVLVIIVNVSLYGALGNRWEHFKGNRYGDWTAVLNFDNIIRNFLNCFSHENWQHTLLNMLCFFVYGIYLERKHGSLYFFLLLIAMVFLTSVTNTANNLSIYWHGFSGVNFGFYAYFIVDYAFSFIERKRNLFNIISGAAVIALIYLAMCFCGGTQTVSFKWYPYDLMHNNGHYTGFLAGLILALIIKLTRLIAVKEK